MAAVEEECEEGADFDDPLALLGGMGEEQVYKVTAVVEADGGADAPSDSPLSTFLGEMEIFLLDMEASAPAPRAPDGLEPAAADADCAALLRLLRPARAGDLAAVLADPWFAVPGGLAEALARQAVEGALAEGVPRLRANLRAACEAFIRLAPDGAAAARRLGMLLVAVASLQLYMRANWTGPTLEDSGPFPLEAAQESLPASARILDALEIDGEPAYELLRGPGHLWLALELLSVFPGAEAPAIAGGRLLPIWRGRAAFAWQLSLADASERGVGQSPTLFQLSICELIGSTGVGVLTGEGLISGSSLELARESVEGVLRAWQRAGAVELDTTAVAAAAVLLMRAPGRVRAAAIVELSARLCWYGRTKPFDGVLQAACDAIGFDFEVTGVMGIKRQYQTVEFAQLMCKAGAADSAAGTVASRMPAATFDASAPEGKAPENLQLSSIDDMTDVLEAPKVSPELTDVERERLEKPLSAVEQVILLARCHWLWVSFNPNDEMTLQEVNALAQRILQTERTENQGDAADGPLLTANWLSFSCGLWYRCKAEHHRNKTRERAAFQLQSLVDQFNDEKPSAGHRLLAVHSAGYPARFHLQREMGVRMMKMGMVSTAHEQFKKLRMWPEAVECLMVAERNVEAEEMIKEQLAVQETPRLWCCLGDIERNPQHFERAWELSKHRFARAQRSLGRHHFMKGDLAKAVESFKLALDINPLHSGIWFTKGVAEMRLDRFKEAVLTFSRCVGIEDENSEAWANLAASHSSLGNVREARSCMTEACRRNRSSWKMWESFLGICMQLRDIQGVIQAMRQLTDLDQTARLQERVFGMVTMAVVTDAGGLYNGTTGRAHSDQLDSFFRFLTQRQASMAFVWRFWAELQEARGEREQSFESRLRQNRAAQAKLWEQRDPGRFGPELADLRDCFEAAASTLEEPCFAELAKQHLAGLAMSVRDAARRLAARLDTGLASPAEWREELAKLEALAARLEARPDAGA